MLEVRVLGPVEVLLQGQAVRFARRQQRLIVGILALEPNQRISSDRLIDLLWGERAPRNARAVLHSRVSEVRSSLAQLEPTGQGHIETGQHGYMLRIDAKHIDAHRFREVVGSWRDLDAEEARRELRRALELWRGPVLGGSLHDDSHGALQQGLEAARLAAQEDLFDLELRRGRHLDLVDEILEAAVANLMRERMLRQAMLALHRSGRSAEALHVYERSRRWLSDELGIDPAPETQQMHVAILNNDSSLLTEPEGQPDHEDGFAVAVPRTLPPPIPDFTGRRAEAQALETVMTAASAKLAVVTGPGGVGKTSLALHVAHRLRDHFPDGQVFVDLKGLGANRYAEPAEVLGRLLRVFGVDGTALPDNLEDRVDLFRDLVAERHVLLVLDNARDHEQIVPLLPGGAGCGVIVTSRARLGATMGASTIDLAALDAEQAADMLASIAGAARVAAEPEAVAQLSRLCGNLPLALRVAGAKLAARPYWGISRLVDLCRDGRGRLNQLTYGPLDVRATITLSHQDLPARAKFLLASLGELDLAEVSVWVASALLDTDPANAEEELEHLYDAHLIDISGRDVAGNPRFRVHDLVRLYATERGRDIPLDERKAARLRVLGCLLHVTEIEHMRLVSDDGHYIRGDSARWKLKPQHVNSLLGKPLAWFEQERSTITALVRRAAQDGHPALCWELTNATAPLFEMRRYFEDLDELLYVALDAAQQAEDSRGTAVTLYRTAVNHASRGRHDRAADLLQQARALFASISDRHSEATMVALRGMIHRFQGDADAAIACYRDALKPLEVAADDGGVAWVLRGIGQIYLDQGALEEADNYLSRSLEISRRLGSQQRIAQTQFWHSMLRLKQNRLDEALAGFQEALSMVRALNDRRGEAQCLRGLGMCHQRRGDIEQARKALTDGLQIVRQPRPTMIEGLIRNALAEL